VQLPVVGRLRWRAAEALAGGLSVW
jgi:hypothetical protein